MFDNDDDRPGDNLTRSNQQFGLLRVIDEDAAPPALGTTNYAENRSFVAYAEGAPNGVGGTTDTNGIWYVDDEELLGPATNPIRIVFNVYDPNGVNRGTDTTLTNMSITIENIFTNNVTNFNLAGSAANTTNNFSTSQWTIVSQFSPAHIDSLMFTTSRVSANLVDGDNDRLYDEAWSSNRQFGYITFIDDDDQPPFLRSFGGTNAALQVFHRGDPSLGFATGSNIWDKPAVGVITNDDQVFRILDHDLARLSATNPLDFRVWMYDAQRLHRDNTGSATNTSLTIGSAVVSNVSAYQASISATHGSSALSFASTNYWRFTSFAADVITSFVTNNSGSGSNRMYMTGFDSDSDRSNDSANGITNLGWLVVTDDDTAAPSVRDLTIEGALANTTNLTDQQIRLGGWDLSMVFEDDSGVITNAGDGTPTTWSMVNSGGTTVHVNEGFTILTNDSVLATNVYGSRIAPFVPKTNVSLGTYEVIWTAQDFDNDRTQDGAARTNYRGIANSGYEITVIDDDTNAPSAITNVYYGAGDSEPSWTNVNSFLVGWDPSADASGIGSYRVSTNTAVPAVPDDGIALAGTTNDKSSLLQNLDFEIGDPADSLGSSNGWTRIGTGGTAAFYDDSASQLNDQSMRVVLDTGPDGPDSRFVLVSQTIDLLNTNDGTIQVDFSGWFLGDLSHSTNGNLANAFLKIEYLDDDTNLIKVVDNEFSSSEFGAPLEGLNITSWTNVYVYDTNAPANTELITFSVGLAQHGTDLPFTGYWDNIAVTVKVIAANSAYVTNAPEGTVTNWLFAVDGDQDRVDDELMGPVTNFLTRLDQTPPPLVGGFGGTNGLDETSEVALDWTPAPHAGIRAGDGDPLSPWYSYIIYYENCETCDVTTNSPSLVYTNGPLDLNTNTTSSAVVSNLLFNEFYRFVIAGIDRAGNTGPLSSTVTVETLNFQVTQGVARVSTELEVAWIGNTNRVYDMLYVDGTSFRPDDFVDNWDWLQRVTNTWWYDTGGVNPTGRYRTPPSQILNTMRFYRVSREDQWQPTNSVRRSSVEVYVANTLELEAGENWHSLLMLPDTNTLPYVFGTNLLPAGATLANATKISWYGPGTSSNPQTNLANTATAVVWLATSGRWVWETGGTGFADTNFAIPLDQGFNIELPAASPDQSLILIGRVPTNQFTNIVIGGTQADPSYNVSTFRIPYRLGLSTIGLEDAGLVGNNNGSRADEIRILDTSAGDSSLVMPKARLRLRSDGTTWTYYSYSTNYFPNGPPPGSQYVLEPDDAVVIIRRNSGTIYWTNSVPYALPGKNFNP